MFREGELLADAVVWRLRPRLRSWTRANHGETVAAMRVESFQVLVIVNQMRLQLYENCRQMALVSPHVCDLMVAVDLQIPPARALAWKTPRLG